MAENQTEHGTLTNNRRKKRFLLFASILVAASILGTIVIVLSLQSQQAQDETLEAIYFTVEPSFKKHFMVSGRPRLIELEVIFALRDERLLIPLTTHAPRMKSAISLLLGDQQFAELKRLPGRELLKEKILLAAQAIMQEEVGEDGIEKVLFSSYTLQ